MFFEDLRETCSQVETWPFDLLWFDPLIFFDFLASKSFFSGILDSTQEGEELHIAGLSLEEYLNERTVNEFVLLKDDDYLVFDPPSGGSEYSVNLSAYLQGQSQSAYSDLSLVDNSLLNLTIEDKSSSTSQDKGTEDHSQDYQQGIALHGGNYDAWMPGLILKGDGYFNFFKLAA